MQSSYAESAAAERAIGSEIKLACFDVAGHRYALEVSHFCEVVRRSRITPLPNSPALIDGVIELREKVIPVVDLARVLGHPVAEVTTASRVAVVALDEMVFGLCVDRATDVVSVGARDIQDPPALAARAGYEAVKAVVCRPGVAPVMLLSLEAILESVTRCARAPSEEN
jgi:purine-binding chemotaxis protein CheW